MRKESLYLDTSIPSAYHDTRAKERKEATVKFWIETVPRYKVHVSEITVEELESTKDEDLRRNLRELIRGFKVLGINKSIRDLARAYVEEGIFPQKYIDDALHVAIASHNEISYLVSWNYEHLVKVKTRRLVNSVNVLSGFKVIEIVSPLEL